ncbi:hypothetical protein WEI85_06350 [Actinomycetes bacterium KLBMP 9797]
MSNQLEADLVRTMADAADDAPLPGEDFLVGVRHRQRIRRRRHAAAVVAGVAVLALAGGATVVRLAGSTEDKLAPAAWSGTVPDFASAGSPREVWPDAVRRLPVTLPDGVHYEVLAAAGADRYLVAAVGGTLSGPYLFDAKAGTVRFLGGQGAAVRAEVRTGAVVGGYAVWTVYKGNDGLELWAAPVGGGAPRQLVDFPIGDTPVFGIAGDTIYWSVDRGSGTEIYRVPLSGGEPALVPGSAGWRASAQSPWLDSKRRVDADRAGELWNLTTGERLTWAASPDAAHVDCDPVLCTGQAADGTHIVQRLDGTGYQKLPYRGDDFTPESAPVEGRFGVGHLSGADGEAWYVWDRVTGTVAAVTAADAPMGSGYSTPQLTYRGFEGTTLQWQDGDEAVYVLDLEAVYVLDLTAIP